MKIVTLYFHQVDQLSGKIEDHLEMPHRTGGRDLAHLQSKVEEVSASVAQLLNDGGHRSNGSWDVQFQNIAMDNVIRNYIHNQFTFCIPTMAVFLCLRYTLY